MWKAESQNFHILDRTFSISSLLRIFPEADFGTLLINVTLRNLLKGATCEDKRIQFYKQGKKIMTKGLLVQDKSPINNHKTEDKGHLLQEERPKLSIYMANLLV